MLTDIRFGERSCVSGSHLTALSQLLMPAIDSLVVIRLGASETSGQSFRCRRSLRPRLQTRQRPPDRRSLGA